MELVIIFARSDALLDEQLAGHPLGVRSRHRRMGSRGVVAGSGGPWLYEFTGTAAAIAQLPALFPDKGLVLYPQGLELEATALAQEHKDHFASVGVTIAPGDPRKLRNLLRAWRALAGEDWQSFEI